MKKIVFCALVVSFSAKIGYAGSSVAKTETSEAGLRVIEILAFAEKRQSSPGELNQALNDLSSLLNKYWNADVPVSSKTTQEMTERLIAIFNRIDNSGINHANKLRIIELIGQRDNSHDAHAFISLIMESKDREQQDMAFWSIGSPGVHGDDIYERITALMRAGIVEKEKYLYALKSANSAKALKEIRDFVSTTKDLKYFVGYTQILCNYGDPNILDVPIARYEEFKNTYPHTESERSTYASAETAFDPKALREYLRVREGKKFRIALEVLGAKGISGNKDMELFKEKMKSKNIETRAAVVEFLDYNFGHHYVSAENIKKLMKAASDVETDAGLKARMRRIERKISGE